MSRNADEIGRLRQSGHTLRGIATLVVYTTWRSTRKMEVQRRIFVKLNHLVRVVSLLVLASAALTAQVARPETVVPLKNWAAPLYWHPTPAERKAAANPVPQLQFSANQVSADALTFVAVTPCRLVDTRGASAGFIGDTPFNGPSIAGGGIATFPVQSGTEADTTAPAACGTIPPIAELLA
jgi:hypothetical protein